MQGRYKKSVFNIIVDELSSGDALVFNSFHSTFGIMDTATRSIFEEIENMDPASFVKEKDSEAFSILLKNGFIVPLELDELSLIDLENQRSKFDSSKIALTIAPTLSCNMACPYCFEQNLSGRMSETVQEALCIFVEKRIEDSNCKQLHITWYGGEPLLAVDIISSLSHRLISLCESKNVGYTASIITNGVFLTREVAEQLRSLKVLRAQVTLDGMAEYHNKRRVLKNGGDSFGIIVKNIDSCYDLLDISVRVNVDEGNIDNIEQFVSFLLNEKGWKNNPSVYLAPVENYTDAEYFEHTKNTDLSKFIQHDAALLEETCGMDNDKPNPRLYPRRRSSFCQAVVSSTYVVDPEGYLYKCWNVIGNKQKAVGTLANNDRLNIEGLKWLSYKPSDECYACPYLPICLGGCPYQYIEKGKHSCGTIKQTTIMRLKLAYQQYLLSKQK